MKRSLMTALCMAALIPMLSFPLPQFTLHQPDLFGEGSVLTNAVADYDAIVK